MIYVCFWELDTLKLLFSKADEFSCHRENLFQGSIAICSHLEDQILRIFLGNQSFFYYSEINQSEA